MIDSLTRAAAELFDRAGRALYGDRYVAPLAFALEVGKETVQKWATGKSLIPSRIFDELEVLIVRRQGELQAAAVAIHDARPK